MEASAHLPGPRADRLLGLAISPYVIAGAIAAGAGVVAAVDAQDLPVWLILAAGASGWSAAWSP
jgi:hypothetical protein